MKRKQIRRLVQDVIRERLGDLIHWQWSNYMRYFFGKCIVNPDGSMTIPAPYVLALYVQMHTEYADLSHREQCLDLVEADRILEIVKGYDL